MSRSIKQFYEIIWILVQVLILFIFSKYFGFKDRSDNFKTMYVLISLIITIYQWLGKENFFKLLINKVFYEMGKKSCEFAKKLYEKCKNKITIEYLEPFYILSLITELILSYFFNLQIKKLYEKCKNKITIDCLEPFYVLSLFVEYNSKSGFIHDCLKCVKLFIALVSGVLKVIYLYFSVLILIKLAFGPDLFGVSSTIVMYYIFILTLMSVARERQGSFFISVIILIATIIIQISDFEGFIMPLIVLVIIPFIDWYYSETCQIILYEENYKEPDREIKKKWAEKKSLTVFFSISFTIVVIIKKLLPAHIKNNIFGTSEKFYNNIPIKKLFELESLRPSTLLSLATLLIFIISWFSISVVLKRGPYFSVRYARCKEKLRKR